MMPADRPCVLVVSSIPSPDDNWVKRLFVGDDPVEVTIFAYNETTNLTLTQWGALEAAAKWRHKMVWIALSHWGLFHIALDDLRAVERQWRARWYVQGPFE